MDETLYKILGVKKEATKDEIKIAFRNKSKETHPDNGGDPEEFRVLKESYDVLSNPEKRKEYDKIGLSPIMSNKDNDILKYLNSYINQALINPRVTAENLVKLINDAIKSENNRISRLLNGLTTHRDNLQRIIEKKCTNKDRVSIKNISETVLHNILIDIQKMKYALEINKECASRVETYKDDFDEILSYSYVLGSNFNTTNNW